MTIGRRLAKSPNSLRILRSPASGRVLALGIVPFGAADGPQQNRVARAARVERRLREGIAKLVDADSTDDMRFEMKLVIVLAGNRGQHPCGLSDYFRPNTVARQENNLCFQDVNTFAFCETVLKGAGTRKVREHFHLSSTLKVPDPFLKRCSEIGKRKFTPQSTRSLAACGDASKSSIRVKIIRPDCVWRVLVTTTGMVLPI